MSNCIIEIKIGDQVIRLDPNSNISPDNGEFLVNSLDLNKLRTLYSNIKGSLDFTTTADTDLAKQGELLYSSIAQKASEQNEFISPVSALKSETNPENRKALAAYLNNLDTSEVLTSGNFLLDMKDAYKLSPYTRDDVRGLLFAGSRKNELDLFNRLTNIPGMETVRMSIAQADEIGKQHIDKPRGVYIRPDNIIQIVVPDDSKYYVHGTDPTGIIKANLTKQALREIRGTMLHELTHAVYSELYIANKPFRDAIKGLHDRFIKYLTETAGVDQNDAKAVYSDPHEFLSDMFVNKNLQSVLNKIISKDRVYESLGRGDLYDFLIQTLPKDYRESDSMLRDALAIMADSVPRGDLSDKLQTQLIDYVDPTDKTNLFFNNGLDESDNDSHLGSNDAYDSYWTVNAKAYRMQKAYLDRTVFDPDKNDFTQKDAYYNEPIENPTQAQIDRLYAQDLVLIPWLRYNKLENKGSWIEQGIVVTDKKDSNGNRIPLKEDGKLVVVDVTRKDGKIVQNSDKGVIEERFRHVPVMYSNIKKGTVVVAKVGLEPKHAEASYQGYNSLSIPYNLIRGIRKYNWKFFDHNHDYEADLKEAKSNLAKSNNDKSGVEARFDRTSVFQRQIERAESNILKAAQIKQELIDLHNKYTYSRVEEHEDGTKTYHKNISQEEYENSGYTKKNVGSTSFASPADALYNIVKRGKDTEIVEPSSSKFEILWKDDSGKAFAKTSQSVAEAVTKGDLVRVHKTEKIEVDGKSATINKYDWLPVYQTVANGVLVATPQGKGMIVGFNNIDAYAKNTTTEAWANLMLRQKDAIDSMEDNMYLPKEDGAKFAKTNPEQVKFRGLKFNKNYENGYEDTNEDAALTRFNKNKEKYVLPMITPNESFVKVARKFKPIDPTEKAVTYQSLEMVLAKTDAGLTTLRITNGGAYKVDHIRFDDSIDDNANYGKELLFLLEDVSKVKNVWDEYQSELDLFKQNKDRDAFTNIGTKDSPKWKPSFDFKESPRTFRDWYDFYDNVNGVTLNRLKEGDVIGIKMNKTEESDLPDYYFRKVIRVTPDGRVAVADHRREDVQYKSGGTGKKGYWTRYVDMKDVAKLGYKIGKVTTDGDDFVSQYHQEIIERRKKLMEYAVRDLDYKDFEFFWSKEAADKFNKNKFPTSGKSKRAIPLTNKILNPKTTEDLVYLDRNLDAVDSADKAAYVGAWFNGDTYNGAVRGISANSTYLKADKILVKDADSKVKLKQFVYDNLMAGDWIVKNYKDANGKNKQWASLIDRIEGKNIYTINKDYSTSLVDLSKVAAIRLSNRNDRYQGNFDKYARGKEVLKALSKSTSAKASLDLDFKSPADSRRALYEIGNRLQGLNPDIKLNYVEQGDVNQILKSTGHDYSNVRAFVMQGQVYINTDKASVSDVIHEYAHLFLSSMKYDKTDLYNSIVSTTKSHPMYDTIAKEYSHLTQQSDLDEEVFVTLLGEYMKGSMDSQSQSKMDASKQVVLDFGSYTKDKLDLLLSGSKSAISSIDPAEILNMRLEDVIQLVGDHMMNNRISDVNDVPSLEFGQDVEALVKDLKSKGFLTEECYE